MGFFILIELLLIFGEEFSKFHLYGPFHLYDTLLLLLTAASIVLVIKYKNWQRNVPLILLVGISLVYLVWSYIQGNPLNYLVRQYAVFVYLICAYVVFVSFINEEYQRYNIRFIALIGISAFVIQFGYHFYLWIRYPDDYSLFGTFNYFNKLGIMALVISGAWALVYIKSVKYRVLLTVAYLFMSVTLGHASAFMACLAVIFAFIMIKVKPVYKIGVSVAMIALLLFFYFELPQFSDTNAQWRELYWKHTIRDLVIEYYGIFGHGFGIRLVTDEIITLMNETLNNPWFEVRPEEQFITPMHNSFITVAYHIGILPSLLLLVPLRAPFRYYLRRFRIKGSKQKDFLILSLVGAMVWASFNVVLELPHSSAFFWLIYFTLLYQFKIEPTEN